MTPGDLLELIRGGEDSTLEFKRDDVQNHDLAKELVSFFNLDGGVLLLGVEDDGRISGTTRNRLEDWVADLCRTKIEPPVIPLLSWASDPKTGKRVLAVRVAQGPDNHTPGYITGDSLTMSALAVRSGKLAARNWRECSKPPVD